MKENLKKNLTHEDLCVKQLLKVKGMTIAQLAEEIGMAREALSRILSGGNPQYSTLAAVAEVLGVSVPQLFKQPEKEKTVYGVIVYKGKPIQINNERDLIALANGIIEDNKNISNQKAE